jgi:H+/gluconate symporter-like permease
LPTPGALLNAAASSATIAKIICCGVIAPKIAEAAFGPIPETEINKVKSLTSSCVKNP